MVSAPLISLSDSLSCSRLSYKYWWAERSFDLDFDIRKEHISALSIFRDLSPFSATKLYQTHLKCVNMNKNVIPLSRFCVLSRQLLNQQNVMNFAGTSVRHRIEVDEGEEWCRAETVSCQKIIENAVSPARFLIFLCWGNERKLSAIPWFHLNSEEYVSKNTHQSPTLSFSIGGAEATEQKHTTRPILPWKYKILN